MEQRHLKIVSNRPAITHEQAAEVLFNCATMLQMSGANEYRIARYRQAALNMMRLGHTALEIVLDEEQWPKMGLGKRLGTKIRELVRDGSMTFYVESESRATPRSRAANVSDGRWPQARHQAAQGARGLVRYGACRGSPARPGLQAEGLRPEARGRIRQVAGADPSDRP